MINTILRAAEAFLLLKTREWEHKVAAIERSDRLTTNKPK